VNGEGEADAEADKEGELESETRRREGRRASTRRTASSSEPERYRADSTHSTPMRRSLVMPSHVPCSILPISRPESTHGSDLARARARARSLPSAGLRLDAKSASASSLSSRPAVCAEAAVAEEEVAVAVVSKLCQWAGDAGRSRYSSRFDARILGRKQQGQRGIRDTLAERRRGRHRRQTREVKSRTHSLYPGWESV
jgi:hypothetical protein